jgi:hypothetical protein
MKKKLSKVMLFVYVLVLVVLITSVVKADTITPTLPTAGTMQDITHGGGMLITIAFNIFAVIFIGTAGLGSVQLVSGMLQQNPMEINHARSAIFASFVGLAGLALIPKLATIIINTFGFSFQG